MTERYLTPAMRDTGRVYVCACPVPPNVCPTHVRPCVDCGQPSMVTDGKVPVHLPPCRPARP